ncbi:MAG: FAD binding domain-containing protein [Sphingobacteriales bacterium]|nr:FAD binding domain-containing protein [Sphingobacteriales bacterium]
MIQFILNEQLIKTPLPPGSTVLDFVRYQKRLMGTKIGCREGDCGACTLLVGDFENDKLVYRSMTSCLMPLINAQGKHIVTVEGINMKTLSPVQQAMMDTNGTQCGFCTIGFVMSFTGFVLHEENKEYQKAVECVDGNICRCTGYKSIERAAAVISEKVNDKPADSTIDWLVKNEFIPAYFTDIKTRLLALQNSLQSNGRATDGLTIGGGTDLNVQKHQIVKKSALNNVFDSKSLKGIRIGNNQCIIGASVTVTECSESKLMQDIFPNLDKHIKLVSSTPIRNMATLAGNLVNASPIGDITVFLLALDAAVVLNNKNSSRTIKLKDFYKGYKQLDKAADEIITLILFDVPSANAVFNFEKVCKRTYLDIASVNAAGLIQLDEKGDIEELHLSAGGVAPYPKYLSNTIAFLKGKKPTSSVLKEAIQVMNDEITPISDARGTADYKRLLLRQLFLAHFANIEETVLNDLLIH